MKPAPKVKLAPFIIGGVVLLLVCLAEVLPRLSKHLDAFERLEWMTYDWRVRQAFTHSPTVATNLAAVFIDDFSLDEINKETRYNWPWPRQYHGRVLRELKAEGARAIGFDILFAEMHPADPEAAITVPGEGSMASDDFFALQLQRNSNVVLSVFGETDTNGWTAVYPHPLFRTNALAIGHVISDKDADGSMRRARPFQTDAATGNRIWHMAIVMAAQQLGLDLEHAVVEPGRLTLKGPNGIQRVIPLDHEGMFYINWSLPWNDLRLVSITYASLWRIDQHRETNDVQFAKDLFAATRAQGKPNIVGESPFRDKLVVIGSVGAGNNISDVGPTPLDKETFLVSKHWNVINSILTNQFVERAGLGMSFLLIIVLGIVSLLVSWHWKAPWTSLMVMGLGLLYAYLAESVFASTRYWLPMALPIGGALFMHAATVVYQVVFEQAEKRHVKNVFSRLVSPNVVHELLSAEQLNLGGSRRRITVLFADVRGFTQMTDVNQQNAEAYVRDHGLKGEEAEAYFDESARETLATVNVYLATIADQVKKHEGTLDKYIGDCVMAFWGAPTPNEKHASSCVHAAVDAQRAMAKLNDERRELNKQREEENMLRIASGQPPLPPLALLSLGTGINTGVCIVGLMGSQAHILNYTVFGREVNLASRLEGVSGRGRVIIGEATYQDLLKCDPELAATCVPLDAVTVKGITQAVQIFEVPWKQGKEAVAEKKDAPDITGFMRMGESKPGAATMMITKADADAAKPAEPPKDVKPPEGKP